MRKIRFIFGILSLVALVFGFSACEYEKKEEKEVSKEFNVKGVDVSSYQADIDWEVLAQSGISFAFIKATEGSSYIDRCFDKNMSEIHKTELAVGAYHFMSFDSDGKSQAENFMSKVEPDMIDLPPVIDLEIYGKYADSPPDFSRVEEILKTLIDEFTERYGRKPIIYTNWKAYLLYVVGVFDDCDIWICDITREPTLYGGIDWKFWQYSHTEKLAGYSGGEKHIDMNVFCGSEEEFKEYIRK